MAIAKNPILNGFYPDPSVCAAEDDFYLVNSTFTYFPGVPIFKSSDLANWEQIGNILDRNSQIPLGTVGHSRGIYAPSIRYNKGTWYLVTTNVENGENFIVTATDPAGPWSEPHFLGEDAAGFDPSLFFDEDGKSYYIGTRPHPEGVRYNGDYEIWIQEINLDTFKFVGEPHAVWKGALREAIWPEGPHLYKRNGWYYVMIAEGGTADDHCVTIARSKEIFGRYWNYPKNPILTHRHLGSKVDVQYVGHGDLVKTKDDTWFMVMLAIRPENGYTVLGRETFLAEVIWENDWPIVNPGIGRLTPTVDTKLVEKKKVTPREDFTFENEKLPFEMMMLRNPDGTEAVVDTDKKVLRLAMKAVTLKDLVTPAFVTVRQPAHDFTAEAVFDFYPEAETDCAGIAVMQSNEFNLRIERYHTDNLKTAKLRVVKCYAEKDEILADETIDFATKSVWIRCEKQKFTVGVGALGKEQIIAENIDATFLSTEVAGGFVGCTVGVYASGNGNESKGYAEFSLLSVKK